MKDENAVIERLSLLKERIASMDASVPKGNRLIGVDLYEYIYSVPRLQQIWADHISYMSVLSKDEYYLSLEILLWEAAEHLARMGLSMCDTLGISDPIKYKNPFMSLEEQPNELTLREVLSLYLNKENRISIVNFDKGKKALGIIQAHTHDNLRRKIVQQYSYLFPLFWFNKSIRDNKPETYSKDFPNILIILKDHLKILENYLILQPVRLSIESFERVEYVASHYLHEHTNYKTENTFPLTVTRLILDSKSKENRAETEKMDNDAVKKAAIEVCDRLIWEYTKKENPSSESAQVTGKKIGRPPKLQYQDGCITDGQKKEIIPKKYGKAVRICRAILDITDDKEEISVDALYGSYAGETEESWDALTKDSQEQFRKLIKNHVPIINNCLSEKGYGMWIERESNKIIRLY